MRAGKWVEMRGDEEQHAVAHSGAVVSGPREVQVWCVRLSGLPSPEEWAAAVEVLRACLASTHVSFKICGISLHGTDEGKVHLQPWLQPLADLFADHTHAMCVKYLSLERVSADAGSIHGLASMFPARKGEAQMTHSSMALHITLSPKPSTHSPFVCGIACCSHIPETKAKLVALHPPVAEIEIEDCDLAPRSS